MIKWGTISMVLVVVLVSSCSSTKNGENSDREDLTAKELLQGVWLDDETDMPLMRISGDTIYYADPQNAPRPVPGFVPEMLRTPYDTQGT